MTKLEQAAQAAWTVHAQSVREIYESGWTGTAMEMRWEKQNAETRKRFRDQTRAVVEALREPTEAIERAGQHGLLTAIMDRNNCVSDAKGHWQAMIDAILNETCAEPPAPP